MCSGAYSTSGSKPCHLMPTVYTSKDASRKDIFFLAGLVEVGFSVIFFQVDLMSWSPSLIRELSSSSDELEEEDSASRIGVLISSDRRPACTAARRSTTYRFLAWNSFVRLPAAIITQRDL